MNPSYTFWYQTQAGYTFEEKRLTKRQAVIRHNRLDRNYNPEIKKFGWKLDYRDSKTAINEEYLKLCPNSTQGPILSQWNMLAS